MTEELPARAGVEVPSCYRYRIYPSGGWTLLTAQLVIVPWFLMGGLSGPNWLWVLLWGLLVCGVEIVVIRRLVREVLLSVDGRLSTRGWGQKIEVDVRQLTEVRVSAAARWGWSSVRLYGEGGSFRLRPNLRYLSGPADPTGLRPGRWSAEGLRDLVYRMYLINPGLAVRGIRPPSWVPPSYPH